MVCMFAFLPWLDVITNILTGYSVVELLLATSLGVSTHG